jgi:hypothetical protein
MGSLPKIRQPKETNKEYNNMQRQSIQREVEGDRWMGGATRVHSQRLFFSVEKKTFSSFLQFIPFTGHLVARGCPIACIQVPLNLG